jgi:ParB-like chromosome segregation protein Spo0J
MPRKKPGAPNTGRGGATPTATAGRPALGSSGSFGINEGQRFLADLPTIATNPRNLREKWEFDTDEFREFEQNLREVGSVQDPIVCSVAVFTNKYPQYKDRFEDSIVWVLIAGERRYRSAMARGDAQMAVVLRDQVAKQGDIALLSENAYRKGFDPVQEGLLYKRLKEEEPEKYKTVLDIVKALGGTEEDAKRRGPEISKKMRLTSLPEGPVRMAVRKGDLGVEPAYLLLTRLRTADAIEAAYSLMQREDITARKAVSQLLPEPKPATTTSEADVQKGQRSTAPVAEAVVAKSSPTSGSTPASIPVQGDRTQSQGKAPGEAEPAPSGDAGTSRASARIDACRRLLQSRSYDSRAALTERLAQHLVFTAPESTIVLAHEILGVPLEMPLADRFAYLQKLSTDDVPRLADAIVMASAEHHVQDSREERADPRAVLYLADLQAAGYDPAPEEQKALQEFSSAKM